MPRSGEARAPLAVHAGVFLVSLGALLLEVALARWRAGAGPLYAAGLLGASAGCLELLLANRPLPGRAGRGPPAPGA